MFNLIDSKRTEEIKNGLKLEARSSKLKDTIQIFNGLEQKELRTLVASADLVVAPSLSEGFGSVHTESVALGKPLLTTFVGPIPEVVRGNVKFISP